MFTVPSGYEFDTGGTAPSVSVTALGGGGGTKLSISYNTRTASNIVFDVTQSSNNPPYKAGKATFSGIQVRPTTGVLPNSGDITNNGTSVPGGTTNYGTLTMAAGAATQVIVETAADGSGATVPAQNLTSGSTLTGYSITRDQYGNFIQNVVADSWSLQSITGGVAAGDLVAAGDMKSAVFTGNLVGSAQISASSGSLTSVNSGTITVVPGAADETTSTITAADAIIANDGLDNTTITVQLKDAAGNNLTSGGDNVQLSTDAGSLSGVTDNGDGTYTATLTSSTVEETATITGTVNGLSMTDNAMVDFQPLPNTWLSAADPDATDWERAANWSQGTIPISTHTAIIPTSPANGTGFPDIDTSTPTVRSLEIQSGASVDVLTGQSLTIQEELTGSGSITVDNATLTVNGDILNSPTITGNTGTFEFAGAVSGTAAIDVSNSTVNYVGSSAQSFGTNINQYGNLEIDNAAGVTANTDVTVSGTLSLTNGNLIIPSGKSLIANTKSITSGALTFQRAIPDSGWYMVSSPVNGTYQDLLDAIVTQGFPNTDYPDDTTYQPNVMWYDETFDGTHYQRWRAPSDATSTVTGGQGLMVYAFGDVAGSADYTNTMPSTLTVSGQEFEGVSGEFDFGVTYTAAGIDTGWNLIGNPFGATIDWDDGANWTKTNMDATIYVWDHTANGGTGDFLVWNGSTGSLGSGKIAPFQGFWVKANAGSPVLKVNKTVKTTGGTFYKPKPPPPALSFSLQHGELTGSCYVMFTEDGQSGKDQYDAYRLPPFTDTYLELSALMENGARLTINNLPYREQMYSIPLFLAGYDHGREIRGDLALSLKGIDRVPGHWGIYLRDRQKDRTVDLRHEKSYTFTSIGSPGKALSKSAGEEGLHKFVQVTDHSRTRFTLLIDTREEQQGLPPDTYRLKQNFPNPVRDRSTIEFDLPEPDRVQITLFNLLGREVLTLARATYPAGTHRVEGDFSSLTAGIYLYQLKTDNKVLAKKLIIVK